MTYLLLQNTKDIILKNVGKETILVTSGKKKTLTDFSKYLLLCYIEGKSKFEMT